MKGIILYKSKYGATRKYAGWLAEETGFACAPLSKASIAQAVRCDVIVVGGGVYASGIAGLSLLQKHMSALQGRKVIAFCVGASPYDEKAFSAIKSRNMKGALASVPLFYARGAWHMDAMNLFDRSLCQMLQKAVARKNPADCEPWEQALLEAGEADCDWTDKQFIAPILQAIHS